VNFRFSKPLFQFIFTFSHPLPNFSKHRRPSSYHITIAVRQRGTSNVAICCGAEPGPRCPGRISGNVAFYLKLQILWLWLAAYWLPVMWNTIMHKAGREGKEGGLCRPRPVYPREYRGWAVWPLFPTSAAVCRPICTCFHGNPPLPNLTP
jgi:hypothetical protein